MIQSVNPASEAVIADYNPFDEQAVADRLEAARKAAARWRTTPYAQRAECLRRVADLLRRDQPGFAALMTTEMGKPIRQAEAEVEKCAWVCEFYAEYAERFLAPQPVATDASSSQVRFDPLGPILAIMPWNFPFWQVFRFAAPALMAGNVGLLKHASNVSGCALAIESTLRNAGLPAGAFVTLLIGSDRVAELIKHDTVRAVTLTGSEPAGMAVAAEAGKQLKKCVLELGGSDPFIVLADADLPRAAEVAATARCQNTGQSCIAAKRFIVQERVADEFVGLFHDQLSMLNMGDPMDPDTDLGPLARADLREDLHDQVQRTLADGAECLLGGVVPEGVGFYYPPTLLDQVRPGMAAFDEETFGPVAPITRARDAEHAIELANQTSFGLGASLWSGDTGRASSLVPRIEAGNVFINEMVKSDPRLPFGGVKRSGYGRELSDFGIREFVNIKTQWVH